MNFLFLFCFIFILSGCGGDYTDCHGGEGLSIGEESASDFKLNSLIRIKCEECDDVALKGLNGAIKLWNEALNNEDMEDLFELSEDENYDFDANVVGEIEGYEDLDGVVFGNADFCEEKCHINIFNQARYNTVVWAHEIGHCIGFNHSNYSKSIMYYQLNFWQKITPDIIEIVKKKIS